MSHCAHSSRTHWKHTGIVLLVLRSFLGYVRQGVGVVGSNLCAATFLRVRGTMSGNESSCHKCPVLERFSSTTLLSCHTSLNVSYSIAPAGRVLSFIPSTDKMVGLRMLGLATGGVVFCFWFIIRKINCLNCFNLSVCVFLALILAPWQKKWSTAALTVLQRLML